MRNSVKELGNMINHNISYEKDLPEELRPFYAYVLSTGHSLMCIIKVHEEMALASKIEDYEIPVPVKYVLEHPYTLKNEYIVIEATYNPNYGLDVNEEYYEY